MTSSPAEFERLRAAFAANADGPPSCSEPWSAERILSAVRGELTPHETRELVELTSSHPEIAEAWRLARKVDAIIESESVIVPIQRTRRRLWTTGLAAAAVVVIGIAAGQLWRPPPQHSPTYRSNDESTITSALQENVPLPRGAFQLHWSGGPEGSTYDLVVSTTDLRILDRGEGLKSMSYLVPEDVLRGLPSGATLLWRVEATTPEQKHLSSPTFVQVLQ